MQKLKSKTVRLHLDILQRSVLMKAIAALVVIGLPVSFILLKISIRESTLGIFRAQAGYLSHLLITNDTIEVHRQFSSVLTKGNIFQISLLSPRGDVLADAFKSEDHLLSFSDSLAIQPSGGPIHLLSWKYYIPLSYFFWIAAIAILAAATISFFFRRELARTGGELIRPVEELGLALEKVDLSESKYSTFNFIPSEFSEFNSFQEKIKELLKRIESSELLIRDSQKSQALANLGSQVAHDIRSPLSALNMVLGTLQGLPEEKRLLIRGATQRINDIANGLLEKSKPVSVSSPLPDDGPIILVPLIDSIVSEKRTQFRDRMEIEIVGELSRGYGLFSKISGTELARVISNLINNSVEAFTGAGKVAVAIAEKDESIRITITDNGKGIPSHVLARLGERGVTHGKEGTQSGSGLGVHHARETIENVGGQFLVESTVGVGTTITLALPKCKSPSWFRESLAIKQNSVVVSVDDDQTIHQIWAGRFSSAGFDGSLNHKMFSSLDAFADWIQADKPSNTIYLIDYEFLGQNGNGLEVIRKLGIENQSILITSRFEEPHVRRTAESLGVKIIPKSLAPFVPIKIERSREKYHAVLIDDDPLVTMTWKMAAQENGKNIICFSDEETFFDSYESIDPSSPLFVDVSLAKGVRGEDVAAKAGKVGFTSIRLATGYDASSVSLPVGVIETVGKDPIFL